MQDTTRVRRRSTRHYLYAAPRKISGEIIDSPDIGPYFLRTSTQLMENPEPSVALAVKVLDQLHDLGIANICVSPAGKDPRWTTLRQFQRGRAIEFPGYGVQRVVPLRLLLTAPPKPKPPEKQITFNWA